MTNTIRIAGHPLTTCGNVVAGNFPAPLAYIYFISYRDGPIKIGLSWNVEKRVKQIQTCLPYKIDVLAVARGPVTLEPEYHARFAAHRLEGEWFERAPEILAEVERINAATPNGLLQISRSGSKP